MKKKSMSKNKFTCEPIAKLIDKYEKTFKHLKDELVFMNENCDLDEHPNIDLLLKVIEESQSIVEQYIMRHLPRRNGKCAEINVHQYASVVRLLDSLNELIEIKAVKPRSSRQHAKK